MKRRNWSSAAGRYAEADAIVVSLGKSGRTWLRVFLYSYFCAATNREFTLNASELADSGVPKLLFTHDRWGARTTRKLRDRMSGKHLVPPVESRTKPIVLLVRDPRDVVVSLFFQVTKRSGRYGGALSRIIRDPRFGIDSIVAIMNSWMEEWNGRDRFKLLRYEDCRKNTAAAFRDVLAFLGVQEIDETAFAHAVHFSSFENMKKLEAAGRFKTKILSARDVNDPDSYKTRRGVVGGFKDYLGPEDVRYLDRAMSRLDERFGYGGERSAPDGITATGREAR